MHGEETDAAHVPGAQVQGARDRLMPQTMRPDFPGKSCLATEGLHQSGHGVSRQSVRSPGGAIEPDEDRSRFAPPRVDPVGQGGAGRATQGHAGRFGLPLADDMDGERR